MTKFEFDNKITAGNLITILMAIIAVFASYYSLRASTEANAKAIIINDAEIKHIKTTFVRKEIFDLNATKLDRIEQKLDRLIEKDK